ncbi:MAG: right-handed parallel beta-helix repeat-containing protein [Planctomycetes bacterium]|nr:right-handed parallel beta-helix repeat-containing protein [Planctomycetota bacterium]
MAKVQNRVYDNNISGNTWGILNDYRAGGNEIYNNTITGNTHGIYLTTGHTPIVYHNNIYGNALSYHAPDGIERELSYNGQGNYWGRTSTPGFVAGVDSTGWWLHDTYPYLVKNGWEHGYPPGKPTDDPTRPDGEIVINGFSKPGPTYTGNPLVAAYLIWADDPAPSYPPLYVRFSTTVAGIESATWQYVDPAELPYWPYAALILPVGDGEKTVYAQLKNKWDFTSTHLLTDKIILDQSPPVNYSITINGGAIATNSRTVTLNLYAEDPHSTVTYMRIRNENTGWPGWSPYVSGKKEWTLSANDGLKTVSRTASI